MSIEVSCTWGDGPDVLVTFDDTPFMLYEEPDKTKAVHGIVREGSFDLNSTEALELALKLQKAAKQAIRLDKSLPTE